MAKDTEDGRWENALSTVSVSHEIEGERVPLDQVMNDILDRLTAVEGGGAG